MIIFYSLPAILCIVCIIVYDVNSDIIKQGGHKPGKPGTLRDFSERGKLTEFSGNSVQPQGKIVTDKAFLVCHSKICAKQLLTV